MAAIAFILLFLGAVVAIALWRAPVWAWAAVIALATLLIQTGVAFGPMGGISFTKLLGWIPAILLGVLAYKPFRSQWITRPAFALVKKMLPAVSATEAEALNAGTVGFDAELFSGEPQWKKLRAIPAMSLTAEERSFLDGPTEELCRLIDDWQIRGKDRDVPQAVWDFVKTNGFLGMLISKQHGGLGFSAQAQSLVIGKIASRSPDVAVIVMVPNSLGPGELIEKFGTDEQKAHFLPRLARGEEVPCFALTGPFAGSDAASMRDTGTVTKGQHNGQEVIGIRLNWDKRYITLSPNATILGLAFQLFDPLELLGKGEKLGITLALVPTNHPGVQIGRRHLPGGNAFPNGPTWGENVFIPLDWIIGGPERTGQGWPMLMSCLAAGRAISLPASSTAAAKTMLRVSSAYARIRSQFHIAIGRMEGIEAPLARIVEAAYLLESARSVTASMVSNGEKPAVISALMKYKTTEWARQAINDAMDIHGGKGICDGPSNYLQSAYQSLPISITVEGANILTRSLMVFAQGALRSHPWLFKEIQAVQNPNAEEGFEAFEAAFEGHAAFATANKIGALFHNITFGLFGNAPSGAKHITRWYRQASRAARNFALVSDTTVLLLGGGLKTRQHITGRLADALAELYFLSCMLKRFEDDGMPQNELPVVHYCARNALHRFYAALDGVTRNFPVPGVGFSLRRLVFPLGNHAHPAKDRVAKQIVHLVLEPGATRDALTRDIFVSHDPADPSGVLEAALLKVVETDDANTRLEHAVRDGKVHRYLGNDFIAEAATNGVVTPEEAVALHERETLVAKVIAVDHFDAAEIGARHSSGTTPPVAAVARPKAPAVEQPMVAPAAPVVEAPKPAPAPVVEAPKPTPASIQAEVTPEPGKIDAQATPPVAETPTSAMLDEPSPAPVADVSEPATPEEPEAATQPQPTATASRCADDRDQQATVEHSQATVAEHPQTPAATPQPQDSDIEQPRALDGVRVVE